MGGATASTPVISAGDEARLRRLFGAATMARGRGYAAGGSVLRVEWGDDGASVTGEVQGTAAGPYHVCIGITRRGEELVDVDARCTCPVGFACKHAVAVLLSLRRRPDLRVVRDPVGPAPPGRPGPSPAPAVAAGPSAVSDSLRAAPPAARTPAPPKRGARPGRVPSWERALRPLLDTDPSAARDLQGGYGLQFELVAERAVPGRRRGAGGPGVRLRPVVPSPSGRWVRAGISWATIDYLGYGRPLAERQTERLALLRELRAVAGVDGARSYLSRGDDAVWLESIASRRVWDLLRQAREVGLPLLRAGRDALPVVLEREAGEVLVDLTRDGRGLDLRPQLLVGGQEVPLGSALLTGVPAHGVVWWDAVAAGGTATPELHLAALSHPLPATTVALLGSPAIRVPATDAARFEAEAYPKLRRQVGFRSSDGSVDLPEPAADVLVCTISHLGGTALEVAWSIDDGSRPRHIDADPDQRAGAARVAATNAVIDLPGMVTPTPWGPQLAPTTRLEGIDAARFVADVVADLSGIDGLRVDVAGDVPDYREVTEAPVVRLGGSEAEGGDWFDLLVEVEVGGEEVPFGELFAAIAGEASHLVLPSGAYFSLDRPELRELAELIAEARGLHDAGPSGRVRVGRFQSSLWEDLERLGVLDEEAAAWSAGVAALVEALAAADGGTGGAGRAARPLPAGLEATLRPYQLDGFAWLAARYEHGVGGILADDMGLGKTLQALALALHAREDGRVEHPFLVVAPTSVVANWVAEAARFAPGLPAVAITETGRRRGTSVAEVAAGAGLVVTSYALFRLEYPEYESLGWAGLFLDEAQFAKNPSSHAYRLARRLPVRWKLAMTGTPFENSLAELWALTSITAPGLFARPERFAETYRTPIERHGDAERLDRLRRRLRPVMLRRTKAAVATDLPEKQERVLELDLEARHGKLYRTYLARERQKVLGLLGDLDGNRFEVLRSLTLLRQAALDVSLVDPAHAGVAATKLDALVEMLDDAVADGHRVLVFSQFTRFLTAARRRVEAAGIGCCYLDGSTRRRPEVIDRFRRGEAPVFLISLKAGGVGLNLAEADHCILLDPWWNPATEAQAVDRAHRIGQTRKVMVHRLVAKGTIEEKVMELKERKAKLFASVIDAGGFESAALTAADIRELLA